MMSLYSSLILSPPSFSFPMKNVAFSSRYSRKSFQFTSSFSSIRSGGVFMGWIVARGSFL